MSSLGGVGVGRADRYCYNDVREQSSMCIIAPQVKWETEAPEGPQYGGLKVNLDRLDFLVSKLSSTISKVMRNKWTLWLRR